MDTKLENEARNFLRDVVGIDTSSVHISGKPWTCLSCLLSKVYDVFCRAGLEGDEKFYKEVEQSTFQRVPQTSVASGEKKIDGICQASDKVRDQ